MLLKREKESAQKCVCERKMEKVIQFARLVDTRWTDLGSRRLLLLSSTFGSTSFDLLVPAKLTMFPVTNGSPDASIPD